MQVYPDLILGSTIGLIDAALYGFSVVVYRSQADEIHPDAVSSIKMWVALLIMIVITLQMSIFFYASDLEYYIAKLKTHRNIPAQ